MTIINKELNDMLETKKGTNSRGKEFDIAEIIYIGIDQTLKNNIENYIKKHGIKSIADFYTMAGNFFLSVEADLDKEVLHQPNGTISISERLHPSSLGTY